MLKPCGAVVLMLNKHDRVIAEGHAVEMLETLNDRDADRLRNAAENKCYMDYVRNTFPHDLIPLIDQYEAYTFCRRLFDNGYRTHMSWIGDESE